MATWNSRGLRGSTLEEFINHTNERYDELGLALIQKIPTPITPVRIDKERRHITLAYFDKVSTVDYIGTVQGIPVCFDAKECNSDTFPLQNIHEHQMIFMEKFEKQGGVAFLHPVLQQPEHPVLHALSGNPDVLGAQKFRRTKELSDRRTGRILFYEFEIELLCALSGLYTNGSG